MTSRFRGLPPRVLLNERSNRGSRIPTVSRTVSSTDRTGAHPLLPFDDRKTIIFEDRTIGVGSDPANGLKYPLLLDSSPIESGLYDSIIDLLNATGTLHTGAAVPTNATGSIVAGISDEFIERPEELLPFAPYVEDRQFEQSNTSSFYLTGTDIVTVGPGFTAPLGSKTQIRLRLPHDGVYQFLATTASIAYYSFVTKVFRAVGDFTNPQQSFCPRNSSDEVITSPNPADPTAASYNYAFDARLFGPLGNAVTSGTSPGSPAAGKYNCPTPIIGHVIEEELPQLLSEFNDESVTLNSLYAAPSGSTIQLNEIQHPFLLEKVSFEIPFSQGSGWSDDTTTLVYGAGFGQDIGGPCITLALMREANDQHREVIMSATIIPEADDFIETYTPAPPFSAFASPHGFSSYSKATVVVTGSLTTGTLRFDAQPSIANGAFALHLRPLDQPEAFAFSRIRMFNPFGRAMRRSPSGRSLFGKEFSIPPRDFPALLSADRLDYFFFEESTPSPYVLLPDDKLILSITKHRPVVEDPSQLANGGDRTAMTASHDVAIPSGTIHITLYGSLIREGEEFHFGRNEPLTSFATSEALSFSNTVLDQFDVEHRSIFSGTYRDEFVSGTIGATIDAEKRQVVGSSIDGTTNKEFQRFVRLLSTSERYFSGSVLPTDPNDFSTKTSMHLRGDRFGQFRDMLEQRIFTKFFSVGIGGSLATSAVSVRFTLPDPADTNSSNLSFEATSSLPFFDGESRNRGDLPSTELVQVDLPDFVIGP